MSTTAEMKEKLLRVRKALALRPGMAANTYSGRCTLGAHSSATYEEGGFAIQMDVPSEIGGGDTAPSPGKMMRAALTGCIAIGVKMEAATFDVDIQSVTVDLESDADDRADFGLDDVPPGYENFRLTISVESNSPEDRVREIVDQSLKQSPLIDAVSSAQSVTIDTRINAGAQAAAE